MIVIAQSTGAESQIVNLLNVVGVGLLLAYGFAHFQQKQAEEGSVEREWRKRSAGVLTIFAFYSVVVATWGPSDTWLAVIGSGINNNIQDFATEVALLGEQEEAAGPVDSALQSIKTVGLITYVAVFGAVSISVSSVRKVVDFVGGLFN